MLPRLNREHLLEFRDATGRVTDATSETEWLERRREIVTGAQRVMGPLPGAEKRVPLAVEVRREIDCGDYVRQEIAYQAEPGSRVPAFLLLPKGKNSSRRGVLALMPTNAEGNRAVVGLSQRTDYDSARYGEELARRGCVVIAPPYPLLADYAPDLKALGYASGTMKAVWDNIRALDVLEQMPSVSAGGFGVIGHSLGGHNGIFTALFDARIAAVVTSCGFDSFLDYGRPASWQPEAGWAQTRYMPRMLDWAREEIPFDFHELLGALAPRALFVSAPRHDDNFKQASVERVVAAARPVYELLGVPERLVAEYPECAHAFPPETREKAYAWLEAFVPPDARRR